MIKNIIPTLGAEASVTVDMAHMIEQLCDYDHPLAEPAIVVMHALTFAGLIDVRDDIFDAVIGIMDDADVPSACAA